MTNGHDSWTDQLSEYLDEELTGARLRRMEEHIVGCDACRGVLEDLRHVKQVAGQLGESQPPRDLWPGIESAMRASPREVDVIALPVGRARTPGRAGTRRAAGVFLSVPQAAAAAVLLVCVSTAATWWAGVGVPARPGAGVALDAPPTSPVTLVANAPEPPAELAGELGLLETTLAQARERLDPNTVRILEKNLGVIQRAIDESVQALAVDPGNAFLLEHLQRAYEEKVDFLRDAVSLAEWEG